MGADVAFSAGTLLRGGFTEDPGRKVVYRIMRDGQEVEWVRGPALEWEAVTPGVHRVEVYTYGARMGSWYFRLKPWIFANPIGLRGSSPPP